MDGVDRGRQIEAAEISGKIFGLYCIVFRIAPKKRKIISVFSQALPRIIRPSFEGIRQALRA